MIHASHFILYVAEQARARDFYVALIGAPPRLDVPGMTELELGSGVVLGLMPERGIERLLGRTLPSPPFVKGTVRAEVYLVVDEPDAWHARALAAGARELDAARERDWGHRVSYVLDLDGHVLAFADDQRGRSLSGEEGAAR